MAVSAARFAASRNLPTSRSDRIEITQRVLVCEPSPREREFRVELHGFVKVLDCIEIVGLVISGPKTVGQSPQVGIVASGLFVGFFCKGLLFRPGQLCFEASATAVATSPQR